VRLGLSRDIAIEGSRSSP